MLGNGRLIAHCFDGKERLCHIRGKMRKKTWVNVGDIILIGLRDYQDEKSDVILRYGADEARELKKRGALPSTTQIHEDQEPEDDFDHGYEFAADGNASSSDEGETALLDKQPSTVGMLPPSDDDESIEVDMDEL